MNYVLLILMLHRLISNAESEKCIIDCPYEPGTAECGLDVEAELYTLYPSRCAREERAKCEKKNIVSVALQFCIMHDFPATRRDITDSCPVFCPTHYSPVCGQSIYRHYDYRTFINRCYLDILNCRGNNEFQVYEEVPLKYCPRHAMKNIFKQNLIVSGMYDNFRDLYRK